MKKLFALMLAAMMLMALAAPAFAAGELGSITINGVSETNVYSIYKLLDLESYDTTSGAYSYKVNAAWAGFFAMAESLTYVAIDDAGYVTWIADEDDDTYRIIKDKFNDTRKYAPVTESGWTAHDWGLFDPEWSKPIDFIFVSKDVVSKEFDILKDEIEKSVYYSDHYAVTAKIGYDYTLKYVD